MTDYRLDISVEQGTDRTYIRVNGRRWEVRSVKLDETWPLHNTSEWWRTERPPRTADLYLGLAEVPTPPIVKPKRRSWATEMGLRKP